MQWGPGTGALDTNLYRSGVGTLKTDNSLWVAGATSLGSTAQFQVASTGLTSLITSTGGPILYVKELGAGYANANAAIVADTDNPTGSSNVLFQGRLAGTNVFAVKADGSINLGSIASGFGTISTGNNITTTTTIQGANGIFTAANGLTLGTSSSLTGGIIFKGSGGVGTLTVAGPTTPNAGNFTLSIPAITGNANICTDNAVCSGYAPATGGAYIARNTNDTSSASFLGTLLGLTNSNAGAAGVLSLTNAGTNSALSVNSSANPTSGQALIFANNSNGAPSGNLIDLRAASSSVFSVTSAGTVIATGGVNSVGGVFKTLDTAAVSSNSTDVSFASGQVTGATSSSGSASLRSGNSTTSGNTGNVNVISGNATSGNSGAVSIDAGTASGTTGAITVGTANASGVTISRTGVATTISGSLTVTQATNLNGGLTEVGTAQLNVTGTAATSIGNSTGTLAVVGGASSSFAINGVTVDASEFNLLDTKNAALVDVNDVVNTAITGTGALASGSIASGFGTISTVQNITTTQAVQGGTGIFTAANGLTLGTASSATGGVVFKGSGGAGTLTLQGPTTPNASNYTLSIPAITANANICTDNSVCTGYAPATGGAYIAKNTNDTSSASFLGTLLGLTNSNAGAAGVLSLTSAGTGNALSITQSANPTAGNALIFANNSNVAATGNLLDLRNNSTSKFSVDASGNTLVLGTLGVTGNATLGGITTVGTGGSIRPTLSRDGATGGLIVASTGTGAAADFIYQGNDGAGGLTERFRVNGTSGNITNTGTINTATISGGTLTATAVNSLNVSGTAISGTGSLTVDGTGAGTVSIAGISTGAVNIGSVGSSVNASTIHIADTSNATGAQAVTIGSAAAQAGNISIIQGGSNVTSAIQLLPGTAGGIMIGAAAGTGTLTFGRSTDSNTINIGNGATASGKTQAVSIANAALTGSTSNVTIGTSVAGVSGTTTINGGLSGILLQSNGTNNLGVTVKPSVANSTAAFQIQNSTSTALFTANTVTGVLTQSITNLTYKAGMDANGTSNGATTSSTVKSVIVQGRYMYVGKTAEGTACAGTTASIGCEIQIYDVSNPASPVYVAGMDGD